MSAAVRVVRIECDPQEIVDMVEERLAWLAVASTEGRHEYIQEFFRRAEPTVLIGDATGVIDVKGVEAYEDVIPAIATDYVARRTRLAGGLIPKLGARLCYAELAAADPGKPQQVQVNRSVFGIDLPQDESAGKYDEAWLSGVQYQLRGFGQLQKDVARKVLAKTPLAQMQCVAFQEVTQFRDGTSLSNMSYFGLSPGGKLLLEDGRRIDQAFTSQVKLLRPHKEVPVHCRNDDGEAVHPVQGWFEDSVLQQYLRRPHWIIELALSKDRTGVGLKTDAIGAREMVRAMQLDGGVKSSRRKALIHWVGEHMRRRRSGGETTVRAHLRGKQEVEAGDYFATIYPSRDALDAACNGARFETLNA